MPSQNPVVKVTVMLKAEVFGCRGFSHHDETFTAKTCSVISNMLKFIVTKFCVSDLFFISAADLYVFMIFSS